MDYSEFSCRWIDKKEIWKVADDVLKNEFDKAIKIIEENKLGQYLESDPDAVLSRISPALCKPFGVSTVVIETRVKREGLWPPK